DLGRIVPQLRNPPLEVVVERAVAPADLDANPVEFVCREGAAVSVDAHLSKGIRAPRFLAYPEPRLDPASDPLVGVLDGGHELRVLFAGARIGLKMANELGQRASEVLSQFDRAALQILGRAADAPTRSAKRSFEVSKSS